MLTTEKIARYQAAGYTHFIGYDTWLPLAECWTESGFPTTADAVKLHEDNRAKALELGLIRNLHIIELN